MRLFFVVGIVGGVLSWAPPASAQSGPFRQVFLTPPISVEDVAKTDAPRAGLSDALSRLDLQDPAVAQQPNQPPPRQHTGFAALVYTTAADFNAFPRRKSTWVILGIGAGAAAIAHTADDEIQEHFADSQGAGVFGPGKYIGSFYVQVGTATGLWMLGRYVIKPAGEGKTNKISHLGFDMVRALIVSQALTQGMKYAFQRDRPTGECCAFPSGHASTVFATASVLERHLGYRGAWPTFAIASYVAASRLKDNRHFLSDVVFGSALGIASGWTVVGRHGRSEFAMVPTPTRGGVMITFQARPRHDPHADTREP